MAFALGFIISLVCAIRAYFIAVRKGRSEAWAIGTLFFTPVFLVLVFLPSLIAPAERSRFSKPFDIVIGAILVILYALSASAYLTHHNSGELPTCDSGSVADATTKALDQDDPDVKKIGVAEIKSHEVFANHNSRQCRAMISYKDGSFDRVLINIKRQGATWNLEVSYDN